MHIDMLELFFSECIICTSLSHSLSVNMCPQDMHTSVVMAVRTLHDVLGTHISDYSRELLETQVLPYLWSTFKVYQNMTTVFLTSSQGLVIGYRRYGPEAPLLGSSMAVAVPSPPSDSLSVQYGYIPDNVTGVPLLDGPMVKVCAIGMCPSPLDTAVFLPPAAPPLLNPAWLVGQTLPKGTVRLVPSIGDVQGPVLTVISSLKNSSGATAAVLSLVFSASRLQPFLQSLSPVQRYNGRMFIAFGPDFYMMSSSNGSLVMPAEVPGGRPSFVSALNSSDEVTRQAARFLKSSFGKKVFTSSIQAHASLKGHGEHYINSIPLAFEGLQLLVVLAVPREELRGAIDDARRKGLIFTMVIVISMFLVGGLAICISTTGVSKKLDSQEKDLDDAAAANKALTEQVQSLMSSGASAWPDVDMGTPLEKARTILKNLKPGHVLTQAQLQQLQALITADDLHKPQFLASMQAGGSRGVLSRTQGGHVQMDTETGSWIEIIATGRRQSMSLRHSPLDPGQASQVPRHAPGTGGDATPARSSPSREAERVSPEDGAQRGAGQSPSLLGQQGPRDSARSVPSLAPLVVGPEGLGDGAAPPGGAVKGDLPSCPEESEVLVTKSIRLTVQLLPPVDAQAFLQLQRMALTAVAMASRSPSSPRGMLELAQPSAGSSPSESPRRALSGGSGAFFRARRGSTSKHAERGASGNDGSKSNDFNEGENGNKGGHGSADVTLSGGDEGSMSPGSASGARSWQIGMLRKLGWWEFDTLALAEVAGDQLVPLVGYSLFLRMGLVREFGLPENKLMNFLHHVSRGMQSHPYHNAAHITDVSASLFHILTHSGVGVHLRSIDKLAAICAALVHDYKHPGVSNDFLSRTREDLATLYNDQSPLENFHLAEAFHLLYSNEHCNFLEVLREEDFVDLRHTVIDMVLATDLKRHFVILDQFKARISQNAPWDAAKESDRMLLLQLSLKVADIGHSSKPLAAHVEWSHRVTEEFYKQGDLERAAKLVVSPFMDRLNNNVPRSQLGESIVGRSYAYARGMEFCTRVEGTAPFCL
eukprot:jgi/Mesvir1/11242/Mv01052-RA.5